MAEPETLVRQAAVKPLTMETASARDLHWRRPRYYPTGLHISERRIVLMLGDLAMITIALLAALWLGVPQQSSLGNAPARLFLLRWHWWLAPWALWVLGSITADCYDLKRALTLRGVAQVAACALVVGMLAFPSVPAPLANPRLAWLTFALLAMIGVGAWRASYAALLSRRAFNRRVLIVGAGSSGSTLAETVQAMEGASGVELVGFVDDNPRLQERHVCGKPVLGTSENLVSLVQRFDVDELVVAVADAHNIAPGLLSALVTCWERSVDIVPMSLYYEELTGSIPVAHVGQNLFALLGHRNALLLRVWGAVRRFIDIGIGVGGLVLLGPLVPFLALAIRLDCPGPIFYRQDRVGQGGRIFRLTKFRSMIPDAEKNGAQWACSNDDRITRVGRFMRKTRIDELPQLWNVLTGEMSFIGPRPERPEFVQQLDELLPYYSIRHSVKPGLTGWAQVRYRYGNTVEDSMKKLQYDLYYVKHRGPVLDALICLHSIRIVSLMKGT